MTHECSVVRVVSCIGGSIPDCMIAFEGSGCKDQLESLKVGVDVSDDAPRL